MAFIVSNPVSVGDKTLKSHYDGLYENTQFLHTNILQVNGAAGVSIGDVTYALVGTSGFRLETAADPMIFEANGGYATNGGLIVYGSSHASAGRVYAATGTAAANGEFLVYDNKNTSNIFSSTYAKTSIRPLLNLFAANNFDIIPGTGTDADAETATGGLRLLSNGSAVYYSGTDVGDGFSVYRAHASAPVPQMVLDCGDEDFALYDATGVLQILVDMGANVSSFYNSSGTEKVRIDHSGTITAYSSVSTYLQLQAEFTGYQSIGWIGSSGTAYVGGDSDGTIHFNTPAAKGVNFSQCDWLIIPADTAAPSGSTAMMYYNTSTNKIGVYNGGWLYTAALS